MPKNLNLCETLASAAQVDEGGKVREVKILGEVSANGYVYTDKAMIDAAKQYAGKPVYVDHKAGQRKYEERIGQVVASVYSDGTKGRPKGVYGDLKLNTKHPLFAQIKEDIESDSQSVGLSHDVYGLTDGESVLSIESVHSVDIVDSPATNKSFSESIKHTQNEVNMEYKAKYEATKAQLDESVAALDKQNKELTEAKEANKSLQEQLDAIKAQEQERARKEEFGKLIEGYDLQEKTVETLDKLHAMGDSELFESLLSSFPKKEEEKEEEVTEHQESQKPKSKAPSKEQKLDYKTWVEQRLK